MATMPMPGLPLTWANQNLLLYHGTINQYEAAIMTRIRVSLGARYTDFGRGSYTTTGLWQARAWAWSMSQKYHGSPPRVIRLTLDRDDLARLEALWFVRGAVDAEDYWSFVHHCRTMGTHHGRVRKRGWYDVVVGPVSNKWRDRVAFPDADQISFHTPRSEKLLNAAMKAVIS